MNVWSVANQKGGVGKTTTTVTLGGILAQRGLRTLLVDLDPHGSLTSYFGHDPDASTPSVYTLFDQAKTGAAPEPAAAITATGFENLSFLPASMALATLDRQLGARGGMGLVLSRTLQRLGDQFDFALIDCPPVLGVLMVNALAACQRLVVPVQTEFLALKGLERMIRTLNMIMRAKKIELPTTIVPTMFDSATWSCIETLQVLRRRYKPDVWRSEVPVDNQFREASRAGIPLSIANPGSAGVAAYLRLLDEILLPSIEPQARSVHA